MDYLLMLTRQIESGTVLAPATFHVDFDEAIDSRDQPEFDIEWMRVHGMLQSMSFPADQQEVLDRLREAAFKTTFELTEHAGLAGYVSDDFGLIGAALGIDVEDSWLNALYSEYRNQRFPHGTIAPIAGTLREIVQA